MPPDHLPFWPFAIAAIAAFAIYRRLRRNFGRQPLQPVRMRIRMAACGLLACLMAPLALHSAQYLIGETAGLAGGMLLGLWGASRTRFQVSGGESYYVPHTYTGIVVSCLLIGRLTYRVGVLYAAASAGTEPLPAGPRDGAALAATPLTAALLSLVLGYYACYFGMVLRRHRHIAPEDLEVDKTPPVAAATRPGDGSSSG